MILNLSKVKKGKRNILLIMLSLFAVASFAQQEQHYTQFQFNKYMYNPALAGTKPYFLAKTNFRFQWLKIVDSPRTYTLSVYGPSRTKPMGFGGYIYSDVTGPTSKTSFRLSYAYNFQVNDVLRTSMGLSVGAMQYKIDGSKITLHDDYDPSLGHAIYSTIVPDASFGIFFYHKKYNFGASVGQLFASKVNYKELSELNETRLRPHIYAHGEYSFEIDDDWDVEPAILVKYVWPAPPQMDLSVRGVWKKQVWLGISWRTMDAVGFFAGYNYQDQIYFGYSYDYTTTNIQKYSSGTHELMITFRFNKIKKEDNSTML